MCPRPLTSNEVALGNPPLAKHGGVRVLGRFRGLAACWMDWKTRCTRRGWGRPPPGDFVRVAVAFLRAGGSCPPPPPHPKKHLSAPYNFGSIVGNSWTPTGKSGKPWKTWDGGLKFCCRMSVMLTMTTLATVAKQWSTKQQQAAGSEKWGMEQRSTERCTGVTELGTRPTEQRRRCGADAPARSSGARPTEQRSNGATEQRSNGATEQRSNVTPMGGTGTPGHGARNNGATERSSLAVANCTFNGTLRPTRAHRHLSGCLRDRYTK